MGGNRILYRVDNLEERRGIWRTWDAIWNPVFDDILPDGLCKDLPMGDSDTYKGGWFASCEDVETLFKWVSPRDLAVLQRNGWVVTVWMAGGLDVIRLNEYETIFLKRNSVMVGKIRFTNEWLEMRQRAEDSASC